MKLKSNKFIKFKIYEDSEDNNSIGTWKNTSIPIEGSTIKINNEERKISEIKKKQGGVVKIILD